MLKNIKFKSFNELNEILEIEFEKICKNNKEFLLPVYFNKHYLERIFVIEDDTSLGLIYSLTYDYMKNVEVKND